jgi:hypothetical protein
MYNVISRVSTSTRLSKISSPLIDVMITDGSNHDITIFNIDMGFSDHKAQILYQIIDEPLTKVIRKRKTVFHPRKNKEFNLILKEEQWEDVCTANEVNICYHTFLVILYYYLNIVFSLKRSVIKNKPKNT